MRKKKTDPIHERCKADLKQVRKELDDLRVERRCVEREARRQIALINSQLQQQTTAIDEEIQKRDNSIKEWEQLLSGEK